MLTKIVILSLVAATIAIAATPTASAIECGQTLFPPSETIRVCSQEVVIVVQGAEGTANDLVDWVQCEILGAC